VVSLLGARVFAAGAAFLANALVARHLGPEHFNSFYLLFAIMTLVAGLSGPAIDTSLVRFAVKHIAPGSDASAPYFKFVLYLKLLIVAGILTVGLFAAQPLLALLFAGAPGGVARTTILLAFLGGAVMSLWGFAQSYFQAHLRFHHYAAYEFLSAMLRVSFVLALIALSLHSVPIFLAAYVTAPLLMGLVAWTRLPRTLFTTPTSMAVGWEYLRFARWVLLATLFTTLTQRLDLVLLNVEVYGIAKEVVGQYGAAVSLVLAAELVLLTFYSVLLPKASKLKSAGELRRFIGDFRLPSFIFCLGLSLTIPLAGPFRQLAFGDAYANTEVYYTILLLGVLVTMVSAPPVTALYSLGHSRMMAGFELLRLVLTVALGLWVIPRFGVLGMAWVMAGARGGVSALTYITAHQTIKRQMIRESQGGP